MDNIDFEEFSKIDIRVGKVVGAQEIEGSDKLIKTTVDFGALGERVVVSGIKKWFVPTDLIGKLLPYVVNLKEREIFGVVSQGMLLAVSEGDGEEKRVVLLETDKDLKPGSKVV